MQIYLEDHSKKIVNNPYVCPYEDCDSDELPEDVNYNEAFTNMCCEVYKCPKCDRQWGIG